jgi:hypothetical protein
MKIGLISDTHNYLDPQIFNIFQSVEHILHAGDVGLMTIINQLETIAPVTAILGNTDSNIPLRESEIVTLAGKKFLLHHIITPHALDPEFATRVKKQRPDVVMFGHTHKPFEEVIDDVLFLNPGYAGRQRFQLPRSVAVMTIEGSEMRTEIRRL